METTATTATESISATSLATNFTETDYALMGQVVEYDAQVAAFAADLTKTTQQKSDVRAAKSQTEALASKSPEESAEASNIKRYFPLEANEPLIRVTGSTYTSLLKECEALGISKETFDNTLQEGMHGWDNGGVLVKKSGIENLTTLLDDKLADLNSQTELKMTSYQSLLDARKQSLLMLSNMISSDHQSIMEIIRNMKG